MKNFIKKKVLCQGFSLVLLACALLGCTKQPIEDQVLPQEQNKVENFEMEPKKEAEVQPEENLKEEMEEQGAVSEITQEETKEKTKEKESIKETTTENSSAPDKKPTISEERVEDSGKTPVKQEEETPVEKTPEQPKPEKESSKQQEEIPDQLDMEQLGDWYMSNEEYDEMVTNSNVGVKNP